MNESDEVSPATAESVPVASGETPPASARRRTHSPAPVDDQRADLLQTSDKLLGEVKSFLQQREQLSRQLDDEIAALERRLVELKETAMLLYPERANPVVKERKPRKSGGEK